MVDWSGIQTTVPKADTNISYLNVKTNHLAITFVL